MAAPSPPPPAANRPGRAGAAGGAGAAGRAALGRAGRREAQVSPAAAAAPRPAPGSRTLRRKSLGSASANAGAQAGLAEVTRAAKMRAEPAGLLRGEPGAERCEHLGSLISCFLETTVLFNFEPFRSPASLASIFKNPSGNTLEASLKKKDSNAKWGKNITGINPLLR